MTDSIENPTDLPPEPINAYSRGYITGFAAGVRCERTCADLERTRTLRICADRLSLIADLLAGEPDSPGPSATSLSLARDFLTRWTRELEEELS